MTETFGKERPLAPQAHLLSRVRRVFDVVPFLILLAGSAVYIFGIDQTISQPNIAFTLGSIQQVHHYTGTERFVYDALFFSADGLAADQTHAVNWIFNVAPNTGVGVQAALFDYAIVTSGEEDVKTTSTPVITEYVFSV
jgi:hypothetical protein